jgi:hypothetical protein
VHDVDDLLEGEVSRKAEKFYQEWWVLRILVAALSRMEAMQSSDKEY